MFSFKDNTTQSVFSWCLKLFFVRLPYNGTQPLTSLHVVGHGMMCNLSLLLYHVLLSGLETLTLHGSTSVLLSIRRSLAIRQPVLIFVYLLVVVGHGMMCNLSLLLYHLLLSASETLKLHGNTSVLLSIRRSLAIRLAVLILVYLLVVAWNAVQPLSSSLSLASKCFRNSYAPWKHFGAFKY